MRRNNRAYFLKRVPADLTDLARGKRVRIVVPAADPDREPTVLNPLVGTQVSFSLGVASSHPAYERLNAAAMQQVLAWFESLRRGPQKLTHQQKDALVGEAYRLMTETLETDPLLSSSEWARIAVRQVEAAQGPSLLIGTSAAEADRQERLEGHYHALLDTVLQQQGLSVTEEDRRDVIRRLGRDMPHATLRLARVADSDHSPDEYAKRFPAPTALPTRDKAPSLPTALTWDRLLTNWRTLRSPRENTDRDWTKIIRDFATHCNKKDPSAVTRDDVRAWRDHLRDDRKLTITGINKTQLAALTAVYNAAIREGLLEDNPAKLTSLPTKKSNRTKMQGYTSEEAGRLLRLALSETKPLLRWAPWLMAQSGARVGEICQLRGDDFSMEAGVAFFWIRHETKTNEARRVPLHGELEFQGLLDFVRSRGAKPLFYDPETRRGRQPHKVLVKDLGYWVHTTGVEVGRLAHRKDPNHAWRHWLTTTLREHDAKEYVIKAIVGHADGSVTSRYGFTPLKRMKIALDKVPLSALIQ